MINRFQKSIWVLSSSAPMLIVFSISWWVHKKALWLSLLSLIIALILIFSASLIFKLMNKELSCIEINAKKVTSNDRLVIGYALSCLLPFGSIAFEKYNPIIFLVGAFLVYLIMIFANTPLANPLLLFVGYHFYDVEGENGIGNYLMMAKKTIRNKEEIGVVNRVTEYFLILQEVKDV